MHRTKAKSTYTAHVPTQRRKARTINKYMNNTLANWPAPPTAPPGTEPPIDQLDQLDQLRCTICGFFAEVPSAEALTGGEREGAAPRAPARDTMREHCTCD